MLQEGRGGTGCVAPDPSSAHFAGPVAKAMYMPGGHAGVSRTVRLGRRARRVVAVRLANGLFCDRRRGKTTLERPGSSSGRRGSGSISNSSNPAVLLSSSLASGRHQIVPSVELHAMPGIVDHGDLGAPTTLSRKSEITRRMAV